MGHLDSDLSLFETQLKLDGLIEDVQPGESITAAAAAAAGEAGWRTARSSKPASQLTPAVNNQTCMVTVRSVDCLLSHRAHVFVAKRENLFSFPLPPPPVMQKSPITRMEEVSPAPTWTTMSATSTLVPMLVRTAAVTAAQRLPKQRIAPMMHRGILVQAQEGGMAAVGCRSRLQPLQLRLLLQRNRTR